MLGGVDSPATVLERSSDLSWVALQCYRSVLYLSLEAKPALSGLQTEGYTSATGVFMVSVSRYASPMTSIRMSFVVVGICVLTYLERNRRSNYKGEGPR